MGGEAWPPADFGPGRQPILEDGDVHVWCWGLDLAPAAVRELRGLLSAEELARGDRFRTEQLQTRFVAAHGRMRQLLGSYLGCDPLGVKFVLGKSGKPEVANGGGLRFSLSHSRGRALLAVARGVEVGVDVEYVRQMPEAVAERYFSAQEVADLSALAAEDQLEGFYRCWTRKEAFLKGLGVGLSGSLGRFAVSVGASLAGSPTICAVRDGGAVEDFTAGWRLQHLEPAPGYVGALAARADGMVVRCFSAGT